MLGITADETERQKENIPKAVKRVTHRIVLYYVSAVFTLGLTVSANDPILPQLNDPTFHSGPFIIMLQRAGLSGLAHIVNAVMVIAAISTGTADIYVAVNFPLISYLIYRVVRYTVSQWKTKPHGSCGRNSLVCRTWQ